MLAFLFEGQISLPCRELFNRRCRFGFCRRRAIFADFFIVVCLSKKKSGKTDVHVFLSFFIAISVVFLFLRPYFGRTIVAGSFLAGAWLPGLFTLKKGHAEKRTD
jgi:hypothetical protein